MGNIFIVRLIRHTNLKKNIARGINQSKMTTSESSESLSLFLFPVTGLGLETPKTVGRDKVIEMAEEEEVEEEEEGCIPDCKAGGVPPEAAKDDNDNMDDEDGIL